MSTSLTPIGVSRLAPTIGQIIDKNSLASFMQFYTNGHIDKQYVMVSHFLEWKLGKRVKSKDNKKGIAPREWTLAYRQVAADIYKEDEEIVIKKDPNGFLLIDAKFLLDNFDRAKTIVKDKLSKEYGLD